MFAAGTCALRLLTHVVMGFAQRGGAGAPLVEGAQAAQASYLLGQITVAAIAEVLESPAM